MRELPVGLSEWAVHPGLDRPALRAIQPDGVCERQSDFDVFMSGIVQETIHEEGIVRVDSRALQAIWRTRGNRP